MPSEGRGVIAVILLLGDRINGRAPISEHRLGASKLTKLEEDVIELAY
jgi:hypothetical protein